MSKPISAYQMGESYAQYMGLNILTFRALLVLVSALLGSGVWFMAALFLALLAHTVWLLSAKPDITAFAFSAFGVVWIAWPLSALISLQLLSDPDWHYLLLCFLIPWLTDTGAYFVGRLIGRHKMAPVISPKKSWEGAVGGLICGVLIVLLYNKLFLDLPVLLVLIIGVVGSVVGQIGDLLESWIKRWAGVKDSGNLIPGHGGILDRFDSMLLVAPSVMIIINLALGFGFIK